jgi:hypothetical protein
MRGPMGRVIDELLSINDTTGIHIYPNEKDVSSSMVGVLLVPKHHSPVFSLVALHAVVLSNESANGRSLWDSI